MKLGRLFGNNKNEVKEESISYEKYELYYSTGTSIVQRFIRDGSYEKEFIDYLNEDITKYGTDKMFLDIGANIGMISLSVLAKNPNLEIAAFEPGQHQNQLMQKTIQANNLSTQIKLFDVALSNNKGIAEFRVHNTVDVSGDGFVDTGRAGKTKKVKVQTDLLDNWWEEQGCPKVGYIKIDTEYWILQGAQKMIASQKPILYLEINDKNIKNYPFEIIDLLKFVDDLGYNLYTLNMKKVETANILEDIRECDSFVAYVKA